MSERAGPAPAKDKTLFTPGPLTTSRTVKLAMMRDLGSRDRDFIGRVRDIRERLLAIAGLSKAEGYEAVLMQGSGTFGVEAVVSSVIPRDGKLLAVINGSYGERIARIAKVHRIDVEPLRCPEDEAPDPAEVERRLAADPAITHVALVHCETTSGIINPIEAIGRAAARCRKVFIVDSMSAFGAVPFDFRAAAIDFLVSSANKCIEGVPGFSFVIARRERLLEAEGRARTLSLDLFEQWKGLEKDGQFRFTPPTHTLLAFEQALRELEEEGGVAGRAARYKRNYERVVRGMRELGFEELLRRELQGWIITSFRYPDHPRFEFEEFYRRLADRGCVIYPGKVTSADCFRIGHIGRIFEEDARTLLAAVRDTLEEMEVEM